VAESTPAASITDCVPWYRPAAWVLYDLANTVYAATLTFLFTPYVTDLFQEKTTVGATQTASMLLAALLVPILGAVADRTARTRRYLVVATLLCIASIAGWGLGGGKGWMLACFFLANITYNLGLLFYNSLLPSVARPEREGLVSGIGVGVGYFGTIFVLAVLLPLEASHETRFLLAAGMFLVAALPCLLLVRDRRTAQPGTTAESVRAALHSLGATLRSLPQHRALLWFLLANFCLVDVLNTAILFFADFTKDVFRDSANVGTLLLFGQRFQGQPGLEQFVMQMGLGLNGLALVFGIGLGLVTDHRPLLVMRCSALSLLGALIGGAWFGGNSPIGFLLTLVVLGAFGLSGIWTAGRKIVVMLAPREKVGEFFGLYGITVKLSVIGSSVYGLVADACKSPKPAILAQSVQLVLGLCFLALVRLPRAGAEAPLRVA
jgi:MFS transporter, UMF1 family